MNLDHLRKQAKNLRKQLPELIAQHGADLTLSQAQTAIARIHGYPGWTALLAANAAESPPRSADAERLATAIRRHLRFGIGPTESLATQWSSETGEPTDFSQGVTAMLEPVSTKDTTLLRRVDQRMDTLIFEELGHPGGGYDDMPPADLERIVEGAREALARCPFYIEGISRLAGGLLTQGREEEALLIAEPAARALLDMIPTSHQVVQVPYGILENRPFHRLLHCYLLLLDAAGRHPEADALAARMQQLNPVDNIGFRFLANQEARRAAE